MKVCLLYSGGKDSSFALFYALQQGFDIKALITFLPEPNSFMFHHPNVRWTRLQAKSAGLKLITKEVKREVEMKGLREVLGRLEVDGVMSGAIASEFQKNQIDMVCEELGLKSFAPLWQKDPHLLLKEISENFEVLITSVSADGLGEEHLGRILDMEFIEELKEIERKKGIHLSGEGGDYETFVLNTPFFEKRIRIKKIKRLWDGVRGELFIEEASLS